VHTLCANKALLARSLKLDNILKRKNPYLFKAKNVQTTSEIIRLLLDAHLSSQEEGIFGGFLEELAIFINSKIFNGRKSGSEGIDLEFEDKDIKYIVSIKSGPNWGNSQQIQRMKDNFKRAKIVLGTNAPKLNIISINGCCYGVDDNPNKGDYLKLCGQRFWEFISGDNNFYIDIIEPLGYKAKEKNEKFQKEYSKVINKFVIIFSKDYCSNDGSILWDKLIEFNSGMKKNNK
jgi:hypothetical protein